MWEVVTSSVSSSALLCPKQSTFRWTVCEREKKKFNLNNQENYFTRHCEQPTGQ